MENEIQVQGRVFLNIEAMKGGKGTMVRLLVYHS